MISTILAVLRSHRRQSSKKPTKLDIANKSLEDNHNRNTSNTRVKIIECLKNLLWCSSSVKKTNIINTNKQKQQRIITYIVLTFSTIISFITDNGEQFGVFICDPS